MTRSFSCLALALLGLFISSVSAQPARGAPAGEPRLAEVRRLLEAGVRVYGPPAALEPSIVTWLGRGAWPGLTGAGAVLSADRLYLAGAALESPHRDTLVAVCLR